MAPGFGGFAKKSTPTERKIFGCCCVVFCIGAGIAGLIASFVVDYPAEEIASRQLLRTCSIGAIAGGVLFVIAWYVWDRYF